MPAISHLTNQLFTTITVMVLISTIISCSQTSKQVGSQLQINQGPPKIKKHYDIGNIKRLGPNTDPKKLGDQRFSPGEHILIKGKNLLEATVTIDSLPSKLISSSLNTLIVKIPAKLNMLKTHQLTVNTNLGHDSIEFKSAHYIIGTDTDGNRHHLMRTNPDVKGYIEEEIIEIEQTRPLFSHISKDGTLFHGIGVQSKTNEPGNTDDQTHPAALRYELEIKIIHLNTANQPKQIAHANTYLNSAPISIDFSHNTFAIILGKLDYAILDISNPTAPKQIAHHKLPLNKDKTVYLDALLLNDAKQLAVLETYQNKVRLFDISEPSKPQALSELKLMPDMTTAYSIDLVRNENKPNQFWVLSGKNMRDLSDRTKTLMKSIFKKDDAPTRANKAPATLIPIDVVKGKLQHTPAITLPNGINPFFGIHDGAAHVYVSGLHSSFMQTFSEEKNWLKKLRNLIFKSTRFGKIYKVNTRTGHSEIAAEGLGIYFHLALTPSLGPVFTLSKFKGAISMPYVKPAWGIGIQTRGTFALRKMGIKTLYPPYSLGHIAIQF